MKVSDELNAKKAWDILVEARNKAIEQKIPLLTYMLSVYQEYMELKIGAEAEFTPDAIGNLTRAFEQAFKTGKIKKVKAGVPIYA